MRASGVFRQLLAATLCAVLGAPAYPSESTLPRTISTASHTYDAETLSKTRVWGSNEKILLHFSATQQLSEKQHKGCAKCSWKTVVGSVVTYDYDAFGVLIHSTGTTPNTTLYSGEQFDPDLGLYYNRARYLNVSTGRFWNMDTFEGDSDSPLSLHKYLYAGANPVDNMDRSGHDFDLGSTLVASTGGVTIFGMSALQSAVILQGVTGALFASSFAGIGAALEGKTPDQIEAATGNPYNIALGALLGVAGSYAAAFRLGRAVLVLASLGGGGSAAYNAYKQDHIAAAVYYATLGLGGALLGGLAGYFRTLKGPIPSVEPASLGEQLALEEAAANADVIIDNADLGDSERLEAIYGDGEWVKMGWTHELAGKGGSVRIHFFKNIDTGQTVEFKFKVR